MKKPALDRRDPYSGLVPPGAQPPSSAPWIMEPILGAVAKSMADQFNWSSSVVPTSVHLTAGRLRLTQLTKPMSPKEREAFFQFCNKLYSDPHQLCRYLDAVLTKSRRCPYPYELVRLGWLPVTRPEALRIALELTRIWLSPTDRTKPGVWYKNAITFAAIRNEGLVHAYDALRRRIRPPLAWSVLRPLSALPWQIGEEGRLRPITPIHPGLLRILPDYLQQLRIFAEAIRSAQTSHAKIVELLRPLIFFQGQPTAERERFVKDVQDLLTTHGGLYDPELLKGISLSEWKSQLEKIQKILDIGSYTLGQTKPTLAKKGEKYLRFIRELAVSVATAINRAAPDPKMNKSDYVPRRDKTENRRLGLFRNVVVEPTASVLSGVYGVKFTDDDVKRAIFNSLKK